MMTFNPKAPIKRSWENAKVDVSKDGYVEKKRKRRKNGGASEREVPDTAFAYGSTGKIRGIRYTIKVHKWCIM
jgi:hypothetical protein